MFSGIEHRLVDKSIIKDLNYPNGFDGCLGNIFDMEWLDEDTLMNLIAFNIWDNMRHLNTKDYVFTLIIKGNKIGYIIYS